jgi:hypothetical protein
MTRFTVHFNVHIPLQIFILNIFENCRSPSKMKPCTHEVSCERQKVLERCNVQNVDNKMNAVVGAHMKRYRNNYQTTDGPSQLG